MKKYPLVLGLLIVLAIFIIAISGVGTSLAAPKSDPSIGNIAPDFTLQDLNKKDTRLKNIIKQNKVTLVNFWATWCPPCQAEVPELVAFYQKFNAKGVGVLAVNLQEDVDHVKGFADAAGIKFPVVTDTNGKVAEKYRVYAIPTTFILDQQGKIHDIITGGTDLKTLETKIKPLQAGK